MDNNKILDYVGLAKRANKIDIGDSAMKAIQSKSAKLVLLSNDCSENTQKKVFDKCKTYHVEVITGISKANLAYAIGRGEVSFVAILDDGFAKAIQKCMK